MQQSWRNDPDKLTFISCLSLSSPAVSSHPATTHNATRGTRHEDATVEPTRDDAADRMIGDVNLFLKRIDEEEDNGDGAWEQAQQPAPVVGEIELMVAEKNKQNRGFGRASLLCFLAYIVSHETGILQEFLHGQAQHYNRDRGQEEKREPEQSIPESLAYLVVRIGATNEHSISLFESLGFARVREEPNYFGELELRKYGLNGDGIRDLTTQYGIERHQEFLYKEQ